MSRPAPLPVRPERVRAFRVAAQRLSDASAAASLAEAAAIGLQDTPPGSAALGLAARMPTARPSEVRRALEEERSLVIAWGRRGSPHLVPASELGMFTRGLLPDDDESWRAAIAGFVVHLESTGMTAEELVRTVADAIQQVLDGRELTKRELGEAIAPLMPASLRSFFEPDLFNRFTATLARAASLFGGFVIAPRHGGEASFVRTDQWLDATPTDDPSTARLEMARRYLSTYGPSSARAYAEWAAMGEPQAKRAFEALADELVRVRIEGADAVVLAHDEQRLLEAPAPEGVRLLPPHDAYLAAIDRRIIVPDAGRHKELWKAAGNPGAILLGDEVVASWRAAGKRETLEFRINEFRTMPASARKRVKELAEKAARFKGAERAAVHYQR